MSGPRSFARPLAVRALDRFATVMLLFALAVIGAGMLAARVRAGW